MTTFQQMMLSQNYATASLEKELSEWKNKYENLLRMYLAVEEKYYILKNSSKLQQDVINNGDFAS